MSTQKFQKKDTIHGKISYRETKNLRFGGKSVD